MKLWVCTTKEFLREARLRARSPDLGIDLTAVQRRKRLQWANTDLRWPLAHWRSVLFKYEIRFQLYWADGRYMYGVM